MKLRNKKTGEIRILIDHIFDNYKTLAELNVEWEDYEEPKEYFYIYADGDIYKDVQDDLRKDNGCKDIGNYFKTKEEAEQAVEKLKAWKRLRDKGFCWMWYNSTPTGNSAEFYIKDWDKEATKDITLLFGGEE
jgi:hypothetical protein